MDLRWEKLWTSRFICILWIVCLTLEKVPGSYGIDLSILPAGVGQLVPSRSGISRRSVEDLADRTLETSLVRPERGAGDTTNSLANEIVCTSVEINSLVGNLVERLGNCTVIEGNLAIGPIDDHDPKYPWESVSFPNLREITGFFLLYSVVGLKSLRDVFPNLAVVRGGRLVRNSAFVIFENKELRDIGLTSLVAIRRGGVFVRKNPSLCYVDTVDWNRITNGDLTNSAKENGDPIKCGSMCDPGCDAYQPRCWTQRPGDCQKVLPRVCGNDPSASGCCHANCLSGCYGTSRNECITCRAVHFDGACMETCPAYTYMYGDRRCLSEDICRNNISTGRNKMKAVNGLCTTECPTHYTVDPNDAGRCIPCEKSCPKVCEGNYNVNTVDGTIQLKTCTIINGSLDIQIGSGDQIVKALEDNLKNIEEVRDYVKVVRSHSVVSLNFLKNLRLIRGERLATGYALSVLDNQHLQDLFDFSGVAIDPDHTPRRSLQVLNGNIGFHYNPRLCLNKIYAFVTQATNRTDTKDPRDISTSSNGDRIACDIQKIELVPMTVTTDGAVLRWKAFELDDPRSLLGYVMSYRESPGRNLTKFDGRDECAGDLWTRMDLDPHGEGVGFVYAALDGLKPARQYAAYINTYTIATEQQGGQSDIIYFTTKSARPHRPVLVQTEAINTTAIRVFWRPPTEANGKIVNYNIVYQPAGEEDTRLRTRNYCTSRIPEKKDYYNLNVLTTTPTPDTCPCNDTDNGGAKKHVKVLEKDQEELINMENRIQDLAFYKSDISRAKREVPSSDTMFMDLGRVRRQVENTTTVVMNGNSTVSTILSENSTAAENNITTPTSVAVTTPDPRMYRTAYETSYVIRDLHHFTDYVIWVEACHAPTSEYTACSEKTLASPSQTRPLKGADDIPSSSVQLSLESLDNTTATTGRYVHVTWTDPLDPNGVIITVDIEWQLMDGKNSEPGKKCVPRTQNADPRASILFEHQHSGNYSFRLQASSFAGNGSWTEPRYIYIEKKLLPQTGLAPSVVGGIVAGVVLGLAIIFGAVFWYFYKRNKKLPGGPDLVSVNPDYYCYKPDEWEVPRENIELGHELGTGTFGKVYQGIAKNIVAGVDRLIVAIKTVNEDKSPSERNFFLQEASIMKSFRCHHVVKLLGVVSEGQPVLVIMEYMANGDLKTWLRNQRPDEDRPDQKPPLFSRLLQMAGEICDGMAYIQSKKFVHRDLAARNCMIADDLTVKIGDFGMTRDVYETDYYRKGGKGLLPVRWMAPESLKDGLFTNESDVWSFGVVLWEIATLAAQPYQGLANEEVLHFVVDGRLMPKPENCPNRIYDMMKRCWSFQPHNRPTFLQMVEELLPDLDEKFRQVSYFSTVDFNDVSPYTNDNDPSAGHELKDLGNRVISLLRDPETRDEEDESETDLLLVRPEAPSTLPPSQSQSRLPPVNDGIRDQSPSLDPVVIVHQNGGSQASSQDGSKGMAMNFPTKDGPGKISNGGVNGLINKITNLT